MALLFFYIPVLIILPLVVLGGIFLLVVPGGFIVLFFGAYSIVAAVTQLAALAVGRALLVARARRARSTRAAAAYSLARRDEVGADAQRLGAVLHEAGR